MNEIATYIYVDFEINLIWDDVDVRNPYIRSTFLHMFLKKKKNNNNLQFNYIKHFAYKHTAELLIPKNQNMQRPSTCSNIANTHFQTHSTFTSTH